MVWIVLAAVRSQICAPVSPWAMARRRLSGAKLRELIGGRGKVAEVMGAQPGALKTDRRSSQATARREPSGEKARAVTPPPRLLRGRASSCPIEASRTCTDPSQLLLAKNRPVEEEARTLMGTLPT